MLDRLHAGVAKVLATAPVQRQLEELGLQRASGTRNQDAAAWEHSIAQTRKILQQVRISIK